MLALPNRSNICSTTWWWDLHSLIRGAMPGEKVSSQIELARNLCCQRGHQVKRVSCQNGARHFQNVNRMCSFSLFMCADTVVVSILIRMWWPFRVRKNAWGPTRLLSITGDHFPCTVFPPADCSTLLFSTLPIIVLKNDGLPKGGSLSGDRATIRAASRINIMHKSNVITSITEISTLVSWHSAGSFSPSSDCHIVCLDCSSVWPG